MNDKLLTKLLELAVQDSTKTNEECALEVGENYFIRTVSYFYTGKVREIKGNFVILDDVSCILDTGRLSESIKEGKLEELSVSEIEPLPNGTGINIDGITDFSPITFKLPKKIK